MMVMMVRDAEGTGTLEDYSNLCTYVARGEARPAYRKAFNDQPALFWENTPLAKKPE